ncbi:hypothetical protein [Nonomuraea jabiensis]|uniref:hypothetical protein n=1 Tax=Nonomuraea jabiensis TaxID=882448 RepID=UPI003D70862F
MDAALADLPYEGLVDIVWQNSWGPITSLTIDETEYSALPAMLAEARAVMILSGYEDVPPDGRRDTRPRWCAPRAMDALTLAALEALST